MTYFLFSFVFILMYGSCVAVLAYKAGKYGRGKMVKAANMSNQPVYFNTKNVQWVLINDAGQVSMRVGGSNFKCLHDENLWIDDFIKGASNK